MHRYAPIPRFPAIERDIAVVVEEEAEAGALLECIRTNGGEYLEDAALFDIYRSEALGEQKKSMAFSVRFRSSEGTLAEEPDYRKHGADSGCTQGTVWRRIARLTSMCRLARG